MKGLVAFSFALGAKEPNPCNMRLALAVKRIIDAEEGRILIVAQWEVALALEQCGVKAHHTIYQEQGVYLDSHMVMEQAASWLHDCGVTEVIPVAQPFLHLILCQKLVRQHGFILLKRKIGKIGFYRSSLQWWTRGPVRLLFCTALFQLTGRRWHARQNSRPEPTTKDIDP
jgi:hypothetical protein